MVRKRFGLRFVPGLSMVLLLALILSGCAGSPSSPQPPTPTPVSNNNHLAVSAQPIAWTSDGAVTDNEYTQFQQIGDLQVYTRLEGDLVCLALRSQKDGFLALGIRPENKMKGADMIICALTGTQAVISDTYSTGIWGPHPDDTKLGGTSDITNPSGSRENGWTAFEFKRKLSTGDSRDKNLTVGDNPIIWSVGGSADVTIQHNNRGYGSLVLQ